MSKTFYIAAACGVAFAVCVVGLARYTPVRSQSISTVQERWEDFNDETSPLIKGPRLVPLTRITPTPEIVEVKEPIVKPTPTEKVKEVKRDICSVNRMRKVYVTKYKWRCKK